MTNGIAIFDDVCALRRIFDENLMACRCVLIHNDLLAIDVEDVAFLLRLQADYDGVRRINL